MDICFAKIYEVLKKSIWNKKERGKKEVLWGKV